MGGRAELRDENHDCCYYKKRYHGRASPPFVLQRWGAQTYECIENVGKPYNGPYRKWIYKNGDCICNKGLRW